MKTMSADWASYLKKNPDVEYVIADPPWNFDDKSPKAISQLKYVLWNNNASCILKLFRLCSARYLFVWVPNSLLDVLLSASLISRKFTYKTLITWAKTTKSGKIHYGLGHWFRNSTEQLVIFVQNGAKPLKSSQRNLQFHKTRPRTGKPRALELHIIDLLERSGCTHGAYLFSGIDEVACFVDYNIDLVDVEFK
jgi:N6-adenosine-specific RNA methylase IME4